MGSLLARACQAWGLTGQLEKAVDPQPTWLQIVGGIKVVLAVKHASGSFLSPEICVTLSNAFPEQYFQEAVIGMNSGLPAIEDHMN